MILLLTSINEDYKSQQFLLRIYSLEDGFDLLSHIVTLGNTLVRVCLLDENRSIELPVEAFDGQSFLVPIQQLEKEWQQVLDEPVLFHAVDNHLFLDMALQKSNWQQVHINFLIQAIVTTEERQLRVQNNILLEPQRGKLLHQLALSLRQYQRCLATAKTQQQATLNRIDKLGQ